MTDIRFSAKLWSPEPEMGSWTFLRLPKTVSAKLGTKGMVKVHGTINGFAFTTSAQPDGKGAHLITVNKTMRAGANASHGDTVTVILAPAPATKEPKTPADLLNALKKSAKANALWNDITARAREEWITWVGSAKQAQTRGRRVDIVVERLGKGVRRVYDKDK